MVCSHVTTKNSTVTINNTLLVMVIRYTSVFVFFDVDTQGSNENFTKGKVYTLPEMFYFWMKGVLINANFYANI